MHVSFITPTALLSRYATYSEYHLVLAQVYETMPEYAAFYRARRVAGDCVVLDNGAYELQESLPVERLRVVADELVPQYVVLPDVRNDIAETVQRSSSAASVLADPRWGLIAVPQAVADDFEELIVCFRSLSEIQGVCLVGMPIRYLPGAKLNQFVYEVESNGLLVSLKGVHFLGMVDPLEVRALAKHPWVFGIDSAKPVVLGLHGIALHPELGLLATYPHRPKNYFELTEDTFPEITEYNIRVVIAWSKDEEAPTWQRYSSLLQSRADRVGQKQP